MPRPLWSPSILFVNVTSQQLFSLETINTSSILVCSLSLSSMSQFILTSSSLSANCEPTLWTSCSVPVLSDLPVPYWFSSWLGTMRVVFGDPFHSFIIIIIIQRNRSNLTSSAPNQRHFHLLGAFDPPNSWTFLNLLPSYPISLSDWMSTVPFDMCLSSGSERKEGIVCRPPPMALSIWLAGTQKKALGGWLSKSLSLKQEVTSQRDNLYFRRNPRH